MPTEYAVTLHSSLRTLVRLQEYRDRVRAAGYGVSPAGADALDVVARLGDVSLNRLASELFVDKSTASRVVALLEVRGLLERESDPRDGRGIRLRLTTAGRELQQDQEADAMWEVQAVWRALGPEHQESAEALLTEWTRIAADHAGLASAVAATP
jgi:MarR family transcriptional regulator, 2-MHQ and catechol-resistance regulon repressor